MKKLSAGYLIGLLCLLLTFTGCEIVGGIFKAGVWVGIILVVIVIVVILRLMSGGGNKS